MPHTHHVNRRRRPAASLAMTAAAVVLLTGCIHTARSEESHALPSQPIDLEQLLEEAGALRQAEAETLREASASVDDTDPSALMGWALVMAGLDQPSDKVRATELLTAYLARPDQAPGPTALATLLLERLQSELALERELSAAVRERDQLSGRVANASAPSRIPGATAEGQGAASEAQVTEVPTAPDDAAARLEELNDLQTRALANTIRERNRAEAQLEELKAIERQMSDRARSPDIQLQPE